MPDTTVHDSMEILCSSEVVVATFSKTFFFIHHP